MDKKLTPAMLGALADMAVQGSLRAPHEDRTMRALERRGLVAQDPSGERMLTALWRPTVAH